MFTPKNCIALIALLFLHLPSTAQVLPLSSFAVGTSGYPNDQFNDHEAFMAAQDYFQQQLGNGTLTLADGEYIIGNQQLWGYPSDAPDPDPTDLIWNSFGYPSGVTVQCPSMVQMQNGFTLRGCSNFTVQGEPGTVIRYRDCLYYGTFYRPEVDEIQSAVGDPCETCRQVGHSPGLLHAAVGAMFTFTNCTGIVVRDLELNGNTTHAILGGIGSFDGNQTSYDGIALEHTSHTLISNVNAHHFGRDGLYIGSAWDLATHPLPEFIQAHPATLLTDLADVGEPPANQTLLFNNTIKFSQFNWNGRQGISWTACSELTVENCSMNYTGAGRVASRPSAGLDIEGGGGPFRVRKGVFDHCNFLHNRGRGIHADTGPCFGQQDFYFHDCTVKAGTEGDAVLPNSRQMVFDRCNIYGNVGPFFEQAENLTWDPLFNVLFTYTNFYEEDDRWSYIKWFAQGPITCKAGPHMFRFTENRAGPVHFDHCSFNTNCKALVRLAGLDATNKNDLPWCPTCPDCEPPINCAPGQTCNTQGPCVANCGVPDARFVKITDCVFTNTGRDHCDLSNAVIAVDLATTLGDFGIEIHIPDAVKNQPTLDYTYPFGTATWTLINCFTEPIGAPYCDDRVIYETPYIEYPACKPFFTLPDLTLNCAQENLPEQACIDEAPCVAQVSIPDGSLASEVGTVFTGTVTIQGLFIVDEDVLFMNTQVFLEPGALIFVQTGMVLDIETSSFTSCNGVMWKGITVTDGATVRIRGSFMDDAEDLVKALDGSTVWVDATQFHNNRVGIGVPVNGGAYNNVACFVSNSTFYSAGPMPLPYTGQTTAVGAVGFAAVDVNSTALDFTGGNNIIHTMSNGIVAHRSDVSVSDCRMLNIQPDAAYGPDGMGAGIYARAAAPTTG